MRIKSVRLKNYKRFTELAIADLPETARLVVLVGPNGTGKSSVFDSFLLKAKAAVSNLRLSGDTEEYYDKISQSRNTHEVASRVGIEFHGVGEGEVDWKSAFKVRSAYRNESDLWGRLREGVPPVVIAAHPPRLARVVDAAVDAGASLVVIDTAPREAGGAAEAARLADLVMIPCRPSAIDLAAIPATLAAIGMADALAVLNASPPRGPWTAQAADAVRAFGIGLAPVTLGARVAHAKGVHPRPDGPGNGTRVTGGPRDRGPIPMGNGGSVTKRTLADALQVATEPKPAAKKTIPSRRGKRAWVTYLDPDTSRRLKAAAAMSDRSMQSLGSCRESRATPRCLR